MNSTDPTALLQRVRLDGHRSQIGFSLLLETLARPGTVRALDRIGLPAGIPPALFVPLALADVEVSVAVVTGDPDSPWPKLLVDATGARLAPPDEADQVVLIGGFGPDHIARARRGTTEDPDSGARLAISCRSLRAEDPRAPEPGEITVELRGPGIDRSRRLVVGGLTRSVFDAIALANHEFPAGVDSWLITPDGRIAAIPRSTRLTVVEPTTTLGGSI